MLAFLTEFMQLKPTACSGWVVAKWTTIAGPQVPIVVHAEAVRLNDHPFAKAFGDLTIGVNVIDRWLGTKQHPNSAGIIRDQANGRTPFLPWQ